MFQIFNASGHPIQQEDVEIVGVADVPNVDLTDAHSISQTAQAVADQAAGAVREGIPVALPGASVLAVHTLAALHGLTGHWPRVAWAARQDGKFVWSEEQVSDLHSLRTAQRERNRT